MSKINLKRSEVVKLKGRINQPSFFDAQNLPKDNILRLNSILTDILYPADDNKGDNANENT
jgi:hypothetical protein